MVPGGFSFGDHLGSGAMLAALMARTLREPLAAFIDRGGLVLGVCNGFQVLVRMGLVPGLDGWAQSVALVHNDSGRFEDRWVEVRFDPASPCLWTRGIERLALPVRHGEGKLVAPVDLLRRIDAARLGAARYATPAAQADSGSATVPYPANPNGSLHNLAGLCDPSGRVFGLMPHPEAFLHRHHHPTWRNVPPERQAAMDDGACSCSATPCAMLAHATPTADNRTLSTQPRRTSILWRSRTPGGVAQLARAREWHSRGRGFDSRRLHSRYIGSSLCGKK